MKRRIFARHTGGGRRSGARPVSVPGLVLDHPLGGRHFHLRRAALFDESLLATRLSRDKHCVCLSARGLCWAAWEGGAK